MHLHVQEADDAPTGNDAEAQAPTHPPDTTSEIAPSAEAALTLPDESEDPADLDQPDGDETEAEDVDEALAALDQLMVLMSACIHVIFIFPCRECTSCFLLSDMLLTACLVLMCSVSMTPSPLTS